MSTSCSRRRCTVQLHEPDACDPTNAKLQRDHTSRNCVRHSSFHEDSRSSQPNLQKSVFRQTTQSEILERRLQGPPFGFPGDVHRSRHTHEINPRTGTGADITKISALKEIAFRNPHDRCREREPRADFLEPTSEVPTRHENNPEQKLEPSVFPTDHAYRNPRTTLAAKHNMKACQSLRLAVSNPNALST